MKKIDNFGSLEGRELLRNVFKELRYEKQRSAFASLVATWRLATSEIDLEKYANDELQVMHSLGFWKGTSIWLEEVVNRFYFTTINSFAYFGAAILLVLVGVRRFSDHVSDNVVIAGIIFEAILLFFMFFVMLFTPNDEISDTSKNDELDSKQELINEVGEISRDFAAATLQLEKLTEKMNNMLDLQNEALNQVSSIAKSFVDISLPNPQLIEIMRETNQNLNNFNEKIKDLSKTIDELKQEQISIAIRKELEQILAKRIISDDN
jgi:methyl-accepting chemotaxis protein